MTENSHDGTWPTGAGRPILVTGMPRSGTTWIGQILCSGREATYVNEPLNPEWRGILRIPLSRWFEYVCVDNESPYLAPFRETVRLEPHLIAEMRRMRRTRRDVLRVARWSLQCIQGSLRQRRVLFKDPFASFSIPWFRDRIGCDVVAVVRHPQAAVGSIKRLAWEYPLADLREQQLLMRDHLKPFLGRMDEVEAGDLVASQSLLWRMIYETIERLATRDSRLIVIRHEDIATDPVRQFERLFDRLGLQFNAHARTAVERTSNHDNPKELDLQSPHSIRVNSLASLDNWKSRLTTAEADRVRRHAGPLLSRLYPEANWAR